jgi:hypothetical protein
MGVALVTPRRSRPFPRRPLALAAAAIVVGVVAAVMSGILSPWYYAVTMRRPPRPLDVPDPRPRFLWVLLFDPHTPYDPPEPFRSRHAGRPYDGEIAYMDSQLGRLLEAARGTGRDWLTVVAGDHGEGLGDHDELTHGFPPTMLELAALPGLDGVDGRSLVDAIAGRPALHGPCTWSPTTRATGGAPPRSPRCAPPSGCSSNRRGPSSTTSSPTLVSAPISPSAGGKSWPNFARR